MKQKIYRYYSTRRPVDIGTFPESTDEPICIHNYDKRIRIEPWGFLAWGYLEYSAPLDARQADDYELKPSPENPEVNENVMPRNCLQCSFASLSRDKTIGICRLSVYHGSLFLNDITIARPDWCPLEEETK